MIANQCNPAVAALNLLKGGRLFQCTGLVCENLLNVSLLPIRRYARYAIIDVKKADGPYCNQHQVS